MSKTTIGASKQTLRADQLGEIFDALRDRGYTLLGPTLKDNAIVIDEIDGLDDLPRGWTDEQDGGCYRLARRDDEALFGYVSGPHSFKKYLFPPRVRLWQARRHGSSFDVELDENKAPKYALVGVRSCDLHAIAIQDKVFMSESYPDPIYKERRENGFILAINCTEPGDLCFCESLGSGPCSKSGYDLSLTEVLNEEGHRFLIHAGSSKGEAVLESFDFDEASDTLLREEKSLLEDARDHMGRSMDVDSLPALLRNNFENPRWEDVADRCLACANCTMVCPTCFCHTVEDTTDLSGDVAERWRQWDSCFTGEFTYFAGGNARDSTKSKYRQWITHKLSTWTDQFGTFGCVGCGRCIAWCPVGIDITEEAAAIRANDICMD